MKNKQKVLFFWSGGKDSALCLHKVLQSGQYEVVALLTTVNEHFKRISMHGVREELLENQVKSIGLPLEKMYVGHQSSNDEYQDKLEKILLKHKSQGVSHVVYGDIFLEDLKIWREAGLEKLGMKALFPLWKIDTRQLVDEFITLGFRSQVCCVNDAYLDEHSLGRVIDSDFIESLPSNVDPCGENGEFHSFTYAGPIFSKDLKIEVGEKVYRALDPSVAASCAVSQNAENQRPKTKGFWFCDLSQGA